MKYLTQGESKLKQIREQINQYLSKKIGTLKLPGAVRNLLFEPWANFLSFNMLRFGAHSPQWRQAAQAIDDVLWYCQAHDIASDAHARQRIQELQQSLPKTLLNGFETVGYDSTQGQALLAALHEQQKNASAIGMSLDATEQTGTANIDDIDSADQTVKHQDLEKQLAIMQLGHWYDLNADRAHPQRVKLAWLNSKTLHYMFVNRLGQQVAIKTGEQLAADIHSGRTKVIAANQDRPFFEKAMERVLQQLEQRSTHTTKPNPQQEH